MQNQLLTRYPIPIQKIDSPVFKQQGVDLSIKRLDMVHPLVSGNKFFKLKYNLDAAVANRYSQILTFGGAYSNHIYATAAAAFATGIKSIGIIRGEENLPLNPTLQAASEKGMVLHYLDRSSYRQKSSETFLATLKQLYGDFFLIPEGGTNELAIKGIKEILTPGESNFTHIALSIGTGGTFLGFAASIKPNQQLLGFSSLKGEFIHEEVAQSLKKYGIEPLGIIKIFDGYHFGGYGKFKSPLIDFMENFTQLSGIPLDPIYTGKMMYGLFDLLGKGFFPAGSNILAIHTGGLQGVAGFNQMHGTHLPL